MIRPTMDKIPLYPLPEVFSFRFYAPGDENSWVELQRNADKFNKTDTDLFHRVFGCNTEILKQRMLFLLDPQGKIIGTAAAWFDDDYQGERYGRVHWLAVHPDYQGQGLSKPLLSAVCEKLVELGHAKAYLSTSSARIPAINLYLKFGFVPQIITPEDKKIWEALKLTPKVEQLVQV